MHALCCAVLHLQFLTQVAFIRMTGNIDEALPLFEKAATVAQSAPCYLNHGMALEAKVFGASEVQKGLAPPPKGWSLSLTIAEEQYRCALVKQPGCVHFVTHPFVFALCFLMPRCLLRWLSVCSCV